MKTKKLDIDKILTLAQTGPSRWELDNVIWNDRASNPKTLMSFLERIKTLEDIDSRLPEENQELEILLDLANDMEEDACIELLSNKDEIVQQNFIETLARTSALEVLTKERVSYETMSATCKLSPTDFILCAKRTQDIINSVLELVIQGETLSQDVAGA
jgi:hypothetical protein